MSISPSGISRPARFLAISDRRRARWMPRVRMPVKMSWPASWCDFNISRQQRSRFFWISLAPRTRTGLASVFFMGGAHHRLQQDLRPETDLVGVGPFERAVADAFFARHEDHAGAGDLGHLHRVVARARRHDLVGNLFLLADLMDERDQSLVEGDRLLGADRQDFHGDLSLGRDLPRAGLDQAGDAVPPPAADAADVDRQLGLAGDGVDDAGLDLERADGSDDAPPFHRGIFSRRLLDID